MKKLLLVSMIASLHAFVGDDPLSKLNGVYKMSQMKYGTAKNWTKADDRLSIKVFMDGYWFSGGLKKGNKEVNGLCGGTYTLKNGKYIEHVDFYSWDSTAVGTSLMMDYKINAKEFRQYGKLNSDKYKDYSVDEIRERISINEPLKNAGLEGVWLMQEGYWGGTSRFGEGKYKNFTMMKIYAYPYCVYAYYNPDTKNFDGGGIVRYQFDGKVLSETNELWTWDMSRRGKSETHKISFKDGKLIQEGWDGKLREVYAKAN
ncbi:MAG: hypothetical protein R2822_27455 [Spirosomataceae bacterium]